MKSMQVWRIIGVGCFLFLINSGLVTFGYGAESKFVLSNIKIAPESANTDMTFSAKADGSVSAEGKLGTVPDKAHPGERKVLDNIFHNSAVHHFKGKIPGELIERGNRVNISGYIFEGSVDQPLTFQCVFGKGYVYISGNGTVTMKDGRVVNLSQNFSAQPSTAVPRSKSNEKQSKPSVSGKWAGETADGISLTATLAWSGGKTSTIKVGHCFPPMPSKIEELSMNDNSPFATTEGNELSFVMPVLDGFSGIGGWYKVKLFWTDGKEIKATLTKSDEPLADYAKKISAKGIALIPQKGQAKTSYSISLKRQD